MGSSRPAFVRTYCVQSVTDLGAGELRVGDRAPNIALVDLAGCASSLLPELAPAQPRRPLVVLAGSYS